MRTPAAPRPAPCNAPGERVEPRPSPPERPQQRDQFESALRRHQHDDELPAPADAAALPWGQPLATAPHEPTARDPSSFAAAAGALPRTAAAQDAVSTHLRALGCAPVDATQAHWQVQWAGATAPVQQVDLRRSDNGNLHLDMSGNMHASDPVRLARLRDRVAALAAVGEVFVLAHPPGAQGRAARRHPDDDEGRP